MLKNPQCKYVYVKIILVMSQYYKITSFYIILQYDFISEKAFYGSDISRTLFFSYHFYFLEVIPYTASQFNLHWHFDSVFLGYLGKLHQSWGTPPGLIFSSDKYGLTFINMAYFSVPNWNVYIRCLKLLKKKIFSPPPKVRWNFFRPPPKFASKFFRPLPNSSVSCDFASKFFRPP